MELRNWVKERFGDTEESLLDESVYSTRELRRDQAKLEQNLNKLETEMDEHSRRYKQLLREGAEAPETKRHTYAQKAKFEKKKYEVKKKKHKANSIKLGTIVSIEGMREIMEMQDGQGLNLDDAMDDIDTQHIQSKLMDEMVEHNLELEDMQEIQNALDIPILDDDLETGASEEIEVMEEMAAGQISEEQLDVEEDVDVDTDDIDVGDVGDVDIEDDFDESAI